MANTLLVIFAPRDCWWLASLPEVDNKRSSAVDVLTGQKSRLDALPMLINSGIAGDQINLMV